MDDSQYIAREVEGSVQSALHRGKSVLLLGPRQTGKTTMLNRLPTHMAVSLIRPDVRQHYEKRPSILIDEVETLPQPKPIVLVDEVQKVPALLDAVQDLVDRSVAQFILTGSSARKLRRGSSINLLPGRVVSLRLDPLTLRELSDPKILINELLLYGALPGIVTTEPQYREEDLRSYVTTYLEQEVRAEAIVRNIGAFSRFLELAAAESGKVVNQRKLSQQIGISHTTVASHYQILEDCLIVERIEPLTESNTRSRLTRAQKYLFFDLGVRRIAAGEGIRLPDAIMGHLFEQFVGLELLHMLRTSMPAARLRFWRDLNGPEVDWVVQSTNLLVPIEVKWTDSPTIKDARHLKLFLAEYPEASLGYIVCRVQRPIKLGDRIHVVPWQDLASILESLTAHNG